jgi:NADH-quinone oxidoreductase subunit C
MEDHGSPALRRLLESMPEAVEETHAHLGDATAVVDRSRIVDALRLLRDDADLAFDMLSDVTAVDYLPRKPRFEVVYHLKARVAEDAVQIASVVDLYASANWMEREVWDLYGIRFDGHPDLRRLLLYDEFEGHPLRKDYPKERRQPLAGPRN